MAKMSAKPQDDSVAPYGPEEWAKWAVLGDSHYPTVPRPLESLVARVAYAIKICALKQDEDVRNELRNQDERSDL